MMLYPLLHYENEKIWLDGDVLKNLYRVATERVDKMERDVYAMIGGQINLNSPVQVAQAFERLGIDTGERTSNGTMSVGIKILADLPKEYVEKFPALKSYINYKKTAKLLSSYIKPLMKEYESRGYCRFAYKTTEVPTGRLACGKDGKNSFFSPINAQCVVGSSELFTDRGVKTIKDILVGDNVWDGESFREVLNTYNNGVRDVYRVTLSNGQVLECTDKHQLYSATDSCDFRELKDLCVGDLVAFNSKSYDVSNSNDNIITTVQRDKPYGGIYSREYTIDLNNPRFWHFIGYFIGDGWYGGKTKEESYSIGLIFNSDELDTMSYIRETLDLLGIHHRVKKVNHDAKYKNLYNLIIKSVGISDMLHDLGIGCRAENKSIPNIVYGLNSECRSMLFRGLMDSDGKSICHYEWSYCTVSKTLAYDVVRLATSLGINSHLIERSNGDYRNVFRVLLLGNKLELFNIIGVTSKHKLRNIVNESGEITLKSPRMGKIHSLLPKCLHDDVIKYNLHDDVSLSYYTKKDGTTSTYVDRCKFNNRFDLYRGRVDDFNFNVHWLKIKSIEYVGKEEVYDIHVDVTHRYCVNGFITHNSLPKPHVKMEDVFDLGDRNLFSKKDNIIMGYKFVYSSYDEEGKHIVPEDSTYIGWVEGMDDDLNLRMAISPKMLEDSGDDEFLYCLDPKTSFIETKEFKYAPLFYVIEKLESGNTVHVKTPKGYRKITNYIHSGKKDAYKLVLKNGREIICSKEHSFMTDRGWVKLKDFTEDDSVIVDENMFSDVSWLPLYGYEDRYKINVHTWEMLGPDGHGSKFVRKCNPMIGSCGCVQYNVSKPGQKLKSRTRGYRVHRAILESYYESSKPFGFQVIDHIDSNKENNTIKNLQIGDHKYNLNNYSTKIKFKNGNNNSNAKHWEQYHDRVQKIIDISTRLGGFTKNLSRLISKKYGVSESYSYWVKRKMAIKENILLFKDSSNIECIINLNHQIDMVDIEVEDEHCFYCNSILTHNCSFDYAAEELRIAANLSREPNWVKAFTSGNDIHKSTACAIWGEEHYNRDYRKMAKYANFSILYGASSHSLYADSRYGFKSLQEAEDFYNKYKKALPTLFQWQDRIIASAKRKGMLQTFFGRPRRLRSYYENRQIGFANRSAGNTSVQGVAGDILKMVMIKLWKVVFNNEEFKNDVSWRVAIHDEIGYTIRATKLMKALKVIKETQSVKLPEWPVEIITDPSVGWSMGRVYDFHMVEDDSELGYHFEPDLA